MDFLWIIWSSLALAFLGYLMKGILLRMTRRLPSGPLGLPLFGYKPFLSSSPTTDYLRLKEKYGDIFGLRLGYRYAVVLSNFADIKEVLSREEFLSRPPNWFRLNSYTDHLCNMAGWQWKETHKFTISTLRNLGVGKSKLEEAIKEEVRQLVDFLENLPPETETNLRDAMYSSLLNIVFVIISGKTFDNKEKLIKLGQNFAKSVSDCIINQHSLLYYPFLKPFFWLRNILFPSWASGVQEMEKFMLQEIEKQKQEFDENNLENYLAYYLNAMKKTSSKTTSLTFPNMLGNALSLVFAGTDSSLTTSAWILLYLAQYPKLQKKMYNELCSVLGPEKTPSWSDRANLPYTNAFIMEVTRFKTLAAVMDPRWTEKEGLIGGFCIPENSMIIPNIEAVHKDKRLWGDPENFRPERFLSEDGKKAIAPEYLIPFLVGKRTCPGAKQANMQLFLFTSSLVQRFEIQAPTSGLCLKDYDYFIVSPVKPVVNFKPRV